MGDVTNSVEFKSAGSNVAASPQTRRKMVSCAATDR